MGHKTGSLTEWNDERGFGFISGDDGQRTFVHISSFKRMRGRPEQGDRVSYLVGTARDGRLGAISVAVLGAPSLPADAPYAPVGSPLPGIVLRLAAASLLCICALAATQQARAPTWVLVAYLMLGCVSILVYWVDKNAAEARRWRVRESSLHLIDLIGGVAGGLVAQALLRHKTRKGSFSAATWLITLVHLGVLAGLIVRLWDFPPDLFPS